MPLILWGLDSQDAVCTKKYEDEPCECAAQANVRIYCAGLWIPDCWKESAAKNNATSDASDVILKNYEDLFASGHNHSASYDKSFFPRDSADPKPPPLLEYAGSSAVGAAHACVLTSL